jgi:hypothetical protein
MILTLTEKRNIVNHVLNSKRNVTLLEAKNSYLLREELKFNLAFYNSVKEAFFKNTRVAINEDLLGILGSLGLVKDLLTGIDVVDKAIEWITKTMLPALLKTVGKFIPKSVSDLGAKTTTLFSDFVKWIQKNLSYTGVAKVFAMIKYKTTSPSSDQINCMMVAAKSAYRYILMGLVSAFVVKMSLLGGDALVDAFSQDVLIGGMDNLMASIGIGKLFTTLFGSYSAMTKAEKAKHLKSDVEKKRQEIEIDMKNSFKKDWNYCDLKGK